MRFPLAPGLLELELSPTRDRQDPKQDDSKYCQTLTLCSWLVL